MITLTIETPNALFIQQFDSVFSVVQFFMLNDGLKHHTLTLSHPIL